MLFITHILFARILILALLCFPWPEPAHAQSAAAAASSAGEAVTLSSAIARAEAGSPRIAAAAAALAAAEGRALQAGLAPNPEARIELENLTGSGPYRNFESGEITISVAQPFEPGGKRRTRREAAALETETARLRLMIVRADVLREVRDRFAGAAAAHQRLLIAEDAARRAQDLLATTRALVEAGREPPLRMLRVEAAAAEAQAMSDAAGVSYQAARRALAALWGAHDVEIDFARHDPPAIVAPDPQQTLDARLAAAELAASEGNLARETAAAIPDVIAEVGFRRFEESGDHAVIAAVAAPIPVSHRNQGMIAAARADILAAAARRAEAIAESARQIGDAQAALMAATARERVLQENASRMAEALRLARLGFEAGKFSLLDVLDAEEAHFTIQLNLAEARLARALAESALLRAAAQ